MAVADRYEHFGENLPYLGCVLVISQDDDFRAAIHNSDGADFLDAFPDFPVFAKKLNRFFLAI
ncbi:MAG: hypothetical protein SGI88_06580 [Candidatus Hydrogenedentes bacterium]|nr:hypothetical protein [Candidatus Hydrogenedentota bacterium]